MIVPDKLQKYPLSWNQYFLLSWNQYLGIGWSEFTRNFLVFLCLTLLINLPIVLLRLVFPSSVDSNIISISVGILIMITVPQVIERSIRGQTVNIGIALQNIVPKFLMALVLGIISSYLFGVIGGWLLSFLMLNFMLNLNWLYIGFLLLFILGSYFWILLSFTYYAIALRNCHLNAFSYSWFLLKGRWWAVFWRNLFILLAFFGLIWLLMPFIMRFILLFSLRSFFLALNGVAVHRGTTIGIQLILNLIFGLIHSYGATVYTILFLNFDYSRNPLEL